MNQIKIGEFIAACRKEKKLTQAQLAEKLSITDRAVSKWETGKSMPDSSLMLELCEILGISVNELLSGEKIDAAHFEERVDENLIALKKKEENNVQIRVVISIIYSAALLIGGIVCSICDLAISGRLTWALIPIVSILFAWIVTFPIIMWGKQGIFGGLLAFSIFAIPVMLLVNLVLAWLLAEPIMDVWDILSMFALLVIGFALFVCDRARNK